MKDKICDWSLHIVLHVCIVTCFVFILLHILLPFIARLCSVLL